jgi:enoyl-CoA hydratase/isomerase-like protein
MHETQRHIEATEATRFRYPRAARGVHGVGSELALASDLRFASREKAILSQWEVGAGLVPGGGPMARLPRLMGRGRALEVLLGADDIDGDLAQIYGYVNRSLPDSELDGFVDAFTTRIASFDKQAIADTKRLVDIASLPSDAEIAPEWNAFIFFFAASRHATKNRQVDGTWLPQAGRCRNASRPLRWPTWKSVDHNRSNHGEEKCPQHRSISAAPLRSRRSLICGASSRSGRKTRLP